MHWLNTHPILLRSLQAAFVSAVALSVALAGRRHGVQLFGQTVVALVRGLVQIILIGLVLKAILDAPPLVSLPVLALMIVIAAMIAARRARQSPGAWLAALAGISVGSSVIIALSALSGAIAFSVREMVPIGSMLIANTMNTAAQAMERFRSDVSAHVGRIEAALALGADPGTTVRPFVRAAVESSMIPRVDNLASLGIVWIPGLMAGMVVQQGGPLVAAVYNFSVIAMIFASSGIAALASLAVASRRAFTPAGQVLIRPTLPDGKKPRS